MLKCKNITSYSDLSFDTVEQMPTEDAVICLLKQIRFLLIKVANSVAPAIDITKITEVPTETKRIYKATTTKTIEIQNISHLTDSPNDLILQPQKNLGLVVKPGDTVRLLVEKGGSIFAKFKDNASFIVINEML